MNIRYRVALSEAERLELEGLLIGGKHAARKVKRAQILLAADAGVSDETIANTVRVSGSTVYRTKRRFVEGNLELALAEEPRPGATRKLSGKEIALLVATACSDPPRGRKRRTLELLADAMVKLTEHESLSRETVRRRLAEDDLKPWRREMWCIAHVDGAYVARMEDVLDLYAEDPDPKRPVVFVDAHKSWRHVKVTDHRAARDFAHCMRDLADTHYPEADRIRVVMDNLSTHSVGALYETFPAPEAHRLLQRLEFHYTPKHASWLNMVEIEIGVLRGQCLDRRIGERSRLEAEIAHWQRRRNASGARIEWRFTTHKAREKLARVYPVAKES